MIALTAGLLAVLSYQLDRLETRDLAKQEFDQGLESLKIGDYLTAKSHFDAVDRLSHRYEVGLTKRLSQWKSPADLGGNLTRLFKKFHQLNAGVDLPDIKQEALEKSDLAALYAQVHHDADVLFQAADGLRFRLLLSEGDELVQAIGDLKRVLKPFYVLENPDWTKLVSIVEKLDDELRSRLINEVNELLFLWDAAIDELLGEGRGSATPSSAHETEEVVDRAVSICDRALVFAQSKGPWQALRARLLARRARCRPELSKGGDRSYSRDSGRPARPRLGNVGAGLFPVGAALLPRPPDGPCDRLARARRLAQVGKLLAPVLPGIRRRRGGTAPTMPWSITMSPWP